MELLTATLVKHVVEMAFVLLMMECVARTAGDHALLEKFVLGMINAKVLSVRKFLWGWKLGFHLRIYMQLSLHL